VAAQYLRVWRPRRRGQPAARIGEIDPEQPADLAVSGQRAIGSRPPLTA
jgi:hypothetical protein